jgi:Vitamin B12 dependent methionine synthase, activation domain
VTNEPLIYTVPAASLTLTTRDIEIALGYSDAAVPEYLPEMIDEALTVIQPLLDIRAGFRIYSGDDVSLSSDALSCRQTQLHIGRIIASRLRHSTAIAVFAATIGAQPETESHRLMEEGNMMGGFIVDTIGSAYAEATAEWIETNISAVAGLEGAANTNRYSPGYCDWLVKEQHVLFSLLPKGFCGISLTQSAVMLPIKSVSGIIGIGSGVKHEQYQCSVCDMQACIRKKLTDAHTHTHH